MQTSGVTTKPILLISGNSPFCETFFDDVKVPKSYGEAAQDLGADPIITIFRVTLPYLSPAMVGGGVFCMLLSFDDFVRSFFLGGYEPTLPVLIFAKLRSGMSPEINAISTIVLVLTALLGLWAERSMRGMSKRAAND